MLGWDERDERAACVGQGASGARRTRHRPPSLHPPRFARDDTCCPDRTLRFWSIRICGVDEASAAPLAEAVTLAPAPTQSGAEAPGADAPGADARTPQRTETLRRFEQTPRPE